MSSERIQLNTRNRYACFLRTSGVTLTTILCNRLTDTRLSADGRRSNSQKKGRFTMLVHGVISYVNGLTARLTQDGCKEFSLVAKPQNFSAQRKSANASLASVVEYSILQQWLNRYFSCLFLENRIKRSAR